MTKVAQLIHNNKVILKDMKYAQSITEISRGLMFASKKRIKKGICLVLPRSKERRFGASITMLFCFHRMEIMFINKEFKVVDKKIMWPFQPSYTPKKACKYVIESLPNTFKDIKLGDKVKIKN